MRYLCPAHFRLGNESEGGDVQKVSCCSLKEWNKTKFPWALECQDILVWKEK